MIGPTTVIIFVAGACVGWIMLRKWRAGGRCHSDARLDGKTVIITGSNTGIGKETAKDLAKRGARVIMACRDLKKANDAKLEVVRECGHSNVAVKRLDLASMASIREFVEEIKKEEKRLDVLLNNAGVMFCPYSKTEDGFEMQLGTNHLGHFLLTHLLLDLLRGSAPSRVVNVSSLGHRRGEIHFDDIMSAKKYDVVVAYAQSKLANILFTRELARQLKGTGVTCYAIHPGVVETELSRHQETYPAYLKLAFKILPFGLVSKTAEQGAQTNIYCCIDEQAGKESGLYYSDCAITEPAKQAKDDEVAKRLWDLSMKLVGLDN